MRAVRAGGLFIFNLRARSTEGYKVEFDALIQNLVNEGKLTFVDQAECVHFGNVEEKFNSIVFVYRCN